MIVSRVDSSNASGQTVIIASGTGVLIQSGVGVTVNSGVGVTVNSGVGVNVQSGFGVIANSGLGVTVNSGVGVTISSGAGVLVQSGLSIASGIGVQVQSGYGVIINSGVGVTVNSGVGVTAQSGMGVTVQSGYGVNADLRTLTNIRTFQSLMITAASGGTTLNSGSCVIATVKNMSGNAIIFVGAAGTTVAPAGISGSFGYPLLGEESISFETSNTNNLGACATTSGQFVSYIGVDR